MFKYEIGDILRLKDNRVVIYFDNIKGSSITNKISCFPIRKPPNDSTRLFKPTMILKNDIKDKFIEFLDIQEMLNIISSLIKEAYNSNNLTDCKKAIEKIIDYMDLDINQNYTSYKPRLSLEEILMLTKS